jgi:hypothetical protein
MLLFRSVYVSIAACHSFMQRSSGKLHLYDPILFENHDFFFALEQTE